MKERPHKPAIGDRKSTSAGEIASAYSGELQASQVQGLEQGVTARSDNRVNLQASQVAGLDPQVSKQPLPNAYIERAHRTLNVDLSHVTLQVDPGLSRAGKAGVAIGGKEVHLAPGYLDDEEVIWHELVHLAQQLKGEGTSAAEGSRDAEAEADAAGALASNGTPVDVEAKAPERAYKDVPPEVQAQEGKFADGPVQGPIPIDEMAAQTSLEDFSELGCLVFESGDALEARKQFWLGKMRDGLNLGKAGVPPLIAGEESSIPPSANADAVLEWISGTQNDWQLRLLLYELTYASDRTVSNLLQTPFVFSQVDEDRKGARSNSDPMIYAASDPLTRALERGGVADAELKEIESLKNDMAPDQTLREFIQDELTTYIEGSLKQRMEYEKEGSLGDVSMTAIQLEAMSEVKRQLNGVSTAMAEQKTKPKVISYYRASHEQASKWARNFESRGGGAGKKGERAEEKILGAGFTAPGISRHGWGTDFDIESTDNAKFKRGKLGKQYDWLNENAKHLGFCQPYKGGRMQRVASAGRKAGIGEERWHWSYYPVSQALLDLVTEFPQDVQERLNQLWQNFSDKQGVDMFQHVRTIWQDLHLNVAGNPFLK